jgi:NADH-quinone oxidoreductase subunit C
MSNVDELSARYAQQHAGKLTVKPVFRGETTWVLDPSILLGVLTSLKADGFNYLVDISSVDNMGSEPRFEMVYELMNLDTAAHLRVKSPVGEEHPEVPTVTHLWKTADWHEREVWDMMGIKFKGHPDLRRILMWDGYPFHPLRKDFPLAGEETDMPDLAFSKPAPLEGGPFVTAPGDLTITREPQARPARLN